MPSNEDITKDYGLEDMPSVVLALDDARDDEISRVLGFIQNRISRRRQKKESDEHGK